LLFGALWLSEIVPATIAGVAPQGLREVLDLAFVLPAMIVTAWLLWRHHALGVLLTVPLLTFAAAMGAAIIGMSVVMNSRSLAGSGVIIAVFVVLVAIALDLAYLFLRRTADASTGGR
jgi:hypothetical protein